MCFIRGTDRCGCTFKRLKKVLIGGDPTGGKRMIVGAFIILNYRITL